jgi:hypothetical protein
MKSAGQQPTDRVARKTHQGDKLMKNYFYNALSILAAKRFVRLYNDTRNNSDKVLAALDTYCNLRRKLPKIDGKHLGNHTGSKLTPWRATQGTKVSALSPIS